MTLDEILKEIKAAEKIVVLTHESPDGDAIGAALAMKFMVDALGKNVDVIIPEYPRMFQFLPESKEIKIGDRRYQSYGYYFDLEAVENKEGI